MTAPLSGASTAPEPEPAACPECGTVRAGRFCEVDGYDFMTATPLAPELPAPEPEHRFDTVLITADREYFEAVKASGGPEIGLLSFPDDLAPRRVPLDGQRILIGRRSRHRDTAPDVDLSGPPRDPGSSHAHALLLPHAGGGWVVVDLGSANGTCVNDPYTTIPSHVPVPVGPGDRIYVGVWTMLTIGHDTP